MKKNKVILPSLIELKNNSIKKKGVIIYYDIESNFIDRILIGVNDVQRKCKKNS